MTEQAKEARRAYQRKWAKDHPERVKAHQAAYWERQAKKARGEGQANDSRATT